MDQNFLLAMQQQQAGGGQQIAQQGNSSNEPYFNPLLGSNGPYFNPFASKNTSTTVNGLQNNPVLQNSGGGLSGKGPFNSIANLTQLSTPQILGLTNNLSNPENILSLLTNGTRKDQQHHDQLILDQYVQLQKMRKQQLMQAQQAQAQRLQQSGMFPMIQQRAQASNIWQGAPQSTNVQQQLLASRPANVVNVPRQEQLHSIYGGQNRNMLANTDLQTVETQRNIIQQLLQNPQNPSNLNATEMMNQQQQASVTTTSPAPIQFNQSQLFSNIPSSASFQARTSNSWIQKQRQQQQQSIFPNNPQSISSPSVLESQGSNLYSFGNAITPSPNINIQQTALQSDQAGNSQLAIGQPFALQAQIQKPANLNGSQQPTFVLTPEQLQAIALNQLTNSKELEKNSNPFINTLQPQNPPRPINIYPNYLKKNEVMSPSPIPVKSEITAAVDTVGAFNKRSTARETSITSVYSDSEGTPDFSKRYRESQSSKPTISIEEFEKVWADHLREGEVKNPIMSGSTLVLKTLFRYTLEYGGYERVSDQKVWKEIAEIMGLGAATNASSQLKKHYKSHLLELEEDHFPSFSKLVVPEDYVDADPESASKAYYPISQSTRSRSAPYGAFPGNSPAVQTRKTESERSGSQQLIRKGSGKDWSEFVRSHSKPSVDDDVMMIQQSPVVKGNNLYELQLSNPTSALEVEENKIAGVDLKTLENWSLENPQVFTIPELGPVDLHHIKMALCSGLELEMTNALNALLVLSTEAVGKSALKLENCADLVDVLVSLAHGCMALLVEGRKSANNTQCGKRKRTGDSDKESVKYLKNGDSRSLVKSESGVSSPEDMGGERRINTFLELIAQEEQEQLNSSSSTYGKYRFASKSHDIGQTVSKTALFISTIFSNFSVFDENKKFLHSHEAYCRFVFDSMFIWELCTEWVVTKENEYPGSNDFSANSKFSATSAEEADGSEYFRSFEIHQNPMGGLEAAGVRFPLHNPVEIRDEYKEDYRPKITPLASLMLFGYDQRNIVTAASLESISIASLYPAQHRKNSLFVLSNIALSFKSASIAQNVVDVLADFLTIGAFPLVFENESVSTTYLDDETFDIVNSALEALANILFVESNRSLVMRLKNLGVLVDRLVELFPRTMSTENSQGEIAVPSRYMVEATIDQIVTWSLAILNLRTLASLSNETREIIASRPGIIKFLLCLSYNPMINQPVLSHTTNFSEFLAIISGQAMGAIVELAKSRRNRKIILRYESTLLELAKLFPPFNNCELQSFVLLYERNYLAKILQNPNPRIPHDRLREHYAKFTQLSSYLPNASRKVAHETERLKEFDVGSMASEALFWLNGDQ